MKKTLSLVLALVMVALMLPVAAFTTSADEAPYYYYEDFTKAGSDDGTSGNISASLPTGWLAKDDPDKVLGHKAWTTTLNYDWVEKPHSIEKEAYLDEPKNIGVRLGGADQGIAMTEAAGLPSKILNAEVDYVLTVTWNSTHKFAHIRFGWSGATVPTTYNVAASQYVALNHTGGPSNAGVGATLEAYGDGEGKGGNWMFNGTYASDIQNEYGNQMSYAEILGAHSASIQAGAVFTSTFEIVDGKVAAVYNEIGGTTVKYMPSADVSAKGYFSIWITNWGANCTANIRTVEIKEVKINDPVFPEGSNTEVISAIKAVQKNLDDAKTELQNAIANGDTALDNKITALDTALKAAEAAYKAADSNLKTELGTKIETADAALDVAIKAVQKNLDDAEAALEKAIADGDKALSDEIAKLREEMTQADDKAQTTQIVLGIVAGVAVAGDISLLAWLLLKRKKV